MLGNRFRGYLGWAVLGGLGFLWVAACNSRLRNLESGEFVIYGWGRAWGFERYGIQRRGKELLIEAAHGFQPGGTSEPTLQVQLALEGGSKLSWFRFSGQSFQLSPRELGVRVSGDTLRMEETGGVVKTVRADGLVFPMPADAPVTLQMMLVRWWLQHNRPAVIPLLPQGQARVQYRGAETVSVRNRSVTLHRYAIGGVACGRSLVWLDADHRLVSAVYCRDPWTLLTIVRTGYEQLKDSFLERAALDFARLSVELASAARSPMARTLVIRGGLVIDGTGGKPLAGGVVLIRNGRILAVGTEQEVEIPEDAAVIDARELTILPGLWDLHVHLRQPELALAYLAAGVTTVRDMLNDYPFVRTLRKCLYEGSAAGPWLLVAGAVDGEDAVSVEPRVDTEPELVGLLRQYRASGFDQVKVYSSFPPRLLGPLMRHAHALGMTVTGHVPAGVSLERFVSAGADGVEHIYFVAPAVRARPGRLGSLIEDALAVDLAAPAGAQLVRQLADRRVLVTPTLVLLELMFGAAGQPLAAIEPASAIAPARLIEQVELRRWKVGTEADRERARRAFRHLLRLTGHLHRAGVPLAAGTDRGLPGWSLHRELELLVEAGLKPGEALMCASWGPSRALGLAHLTGSIRPGLRADLIIIEGDPLENISATRNVRWVIRGGQLYDARRLWEAFRAAF